MWFVPRPKTVPKKRQPPGQLRGFLRAFSLPENIDVEGIAAQSKDSVLTVTLPKVPQAQPKRIEITS